MTDVELAQACLAGDRRALEHLDGLICQIAPHDELRQAVRQRLLVEGGLAKFQGRSTLWRWLQTVTARLEVDLRRANRDEAVENPVLEALMPAAPHGEAQLIDSQAREAITRAMKEALGQLEPRDRLFVQHAYLDGMSLTAIGQIYGVAPSTVMRAIDRSLATLREAARQCLSQHQALSGQSLESLVRTGLKTAP